MKIIYETAIKIAQEQQAAIIRLDIQFNFKSQTHTGYLILANGFEYSLDSAGRKNYVNVK